MSMTAVELIRYPKYNDNLLPHIFTTGINFLSNFHRTEPRHVLFHKSTSRQPQPVTRIEAPFRVKLKFFKDLMKQIMKWLIWASSWINTKIDRWHKVQRPAQKLAYSFMYKSATKQTNSDLKPFSPVDPQTTASQKWAHGTPCDVVNPTF